MMEAAAIIHHTKLKIPAQLFNVRRANHSNQIIWISHAQKEAAPLNLAADQTHNAIHLSARQISM